MKTWLETTGVAGQRLRFDLARPCVRVGSIGTADVWVPLPGVNRLHCRIEATPGGWTVRPTAGATVTINETEHGAPAPLSVGDRLRIASVGFHVRADAPELEIEVPARSESKAQQIASTSDRE